MIELKKVTKSFGKQVVLDEINLNITPGSISAILGPNGSGKTTIIKSILGLVIPNSGEIYVDNQPTIHQWQYRSKIDYLPQIARFPENLTVKELLALVKDMRSQESSEDDLLKRFGLVESVDKKLRNLSGGTRQKVNIVITFMFDNPVLILDEPSSGLDPVSLLTLKDLVLEEKAKGKTILLTTHIMSLVENLADEVVFLLEGKVYFQGTKDEIISLTPASDLERSIAHLLSNSHQEQPVSANQMEESYE